MQNFWFFRFLLFRIPQGLPIPASPSDVCRIHFRKALRNYVVHSFSFIFLSTPIFLFEIREIFVRGVPVIRGPMVDIDF